MCDKPLMYDRVLGELMFGIRDNVLQSGANL